MKEEIVYLTRRFCARNSGGNFDLLRVDVLVDEVFV